MIGDRDARDQCIDIDGQKSSCWPWPPRLVSCSCPCALVGCRSAGVIGQLWRKKQATLQPGQLLEWISQTGVEWSGCIVSYLLYTSLSSTPPRGLGFDGKCSLLPTAAHCPLRSVPTVLAPQQGFWLQFRLLGRSDPCASHVAGGGEGCSAPWDPWSLLWRSSMGRERACLTFTLACD